MKKVLINICAIPSIITLLFLWVPYSWSQSGIPNPIIDSLISINRLNDKAIVVGIGADAVTAIATQKGIVIIDAGISGTLTSQYRKTIEKELERNDFAYVVNTHGHHDHTFGNIAFTEAKIIAHENSIKEMSQHISDTARLRAKLRATVNQYDEKIKGMVKGSSDWKEALCQRTRYYYAYEDALNNAAVRYPDLLFSDTLNLSIGDVTLNMIWFGKAHNESDIIIHIPEQKIFFTGDLFFRYGRPSFDSIDKQYLQIYQKALEWMEARTTPNDIIINGHGTIMKQDDMKGFIDNIKKKIKELE
jgi:cyclase